MAFSDITILDVAAIPAALRLSQEAGWAQTADDWRAFMDHGTVYGIRNEGLLAGTGAIMPYPSGGFGFVAMVLVTAAHRRQGLATRLVSTSLAALQQRSLIPVLDATPAGYPVYQRLGFQDMFGLERWAGEARGQPEAQPIPDGIAALDAAAFGADRSALLRSFLDRPGAQAVMRPFGFALARPATGATQLGPLVAGDVKQASTLLISLLRHVSGPAFLDVPQRWGAIASLLERIGFRRQRPFTRMGLGRGEPFGDPSRLFAAAGPEFG